MSTRKEAHTCGSLLEGKMYAITRAHIAILNHVRENVQADMPIQQWQMLLLICTNPGCTSGEIKSQLNMTAGALSRHFKTLSQWRDPKTKEIKGFDLIYGEPSLENRKEFCYYLTRLGDEVLGGIIKEYIKLLDGVCK